MRQYLPVLRRVPLFAGLEEEQLMEALECLAARVKCAAKAAAVFRAGEKAAALGCVLSGGVQVCREDASGERIVLAGLEAGELFGEAYAFAQDNTLAVSVYALEPTTVLPVPARRRWSPASGRVPFMPADPQFSDAAGGKESTAFPEYSVSVRPHHPGKADGLSGGAGAPRRTGQLYRSL